MRYFISLALVATVSAQMDMKALIGDMSPQCQAAAGGLMTSEFSTCSNMMGLVSILGASGSLLAPWNAWVDSICSIAPCTPSVVTTATTTVHSGCEADQKKGVPAALEISMLVTNYPVIRNALCLEYKSNHTRCASNLLASAEKASGRPLTLLEVSGFLTEGVNSLAPVLAKAPKENICNDCAHALTSVLAPGSSMPSMASNSTMPPMAMNSSMASMPMNGTPSKAAGPTSAVATMCGASFADGKIPDTVTVANGTSSSSPANPSKGPSDGAPNSANSITIPVFTSLAILGTATVFAFFF
ncbi:hypothetical protein MJO28_007165 [Puccinia striiformis f. sp. tritici]|nr:hypothetical protein Pst134EA_013251 [Puccinia striiformis f. sp. tritici]KAI9625464.1 hypothetical protein H4Q26_016262 [Puccinia striiformis f. sp. tritici PST-130]KNE92486.1 hypothetical protein PSTG_14086 [Puccinia striiformis f. sp. tritici PST-78]POW17921.1 hypothetical protein PSTT_00120 [Puccinia striiformis]KAH9454157.1 hypothetical protein Pst134EB_014252 [Puccinia striiformis f. sp. tritici]KAH9465365.1 hypothetical protein Pst134EA_013251 [Puccinia striiformis f. sp. tritici]